jgi:hypothetical protein
MKLSFSAYCGMSYDISGDDARTAAARFIRRRRKNGQTVVKLRANRWECQEPENCSMIPDTAGILCLDDDFEDDFEDDDDDDYLDEAEYWQNENEDERDDDDEEEE